MEEKHPEAEHTFLLSILYCKKQYKNYNTVMVQLEFHDILQTFSGLNRMMLNTSQHKYDLDEMSS
jgi:hypothetical protein